MIGHSPQNPQCVAVLLQHTLSLLSIITIITITRIVYTATLLRSSMQPTFRCACASEHLPHLLCLRTQKQRCTMFPLNKWSFTKSAVSTPSSTLLVLVPHLKFWASTALPHHPLPYHTVPLVAHTAFFPTQGQLLPTCLQHMRCPRAV